MNTGILITILGLWIWNAGLSLQLYAVREQLKVQDEINRLYYENTKTVSELLEEHWRREVKKGKKIFPKGVPSWEDRPIGQR
jgi:hypothetical protein